MGHGMPRVADLDERTRSAVAGDGADDVEGRSEVVQHQDGLLAADESAAGLRLSRPNERRSHPVPSPISQACILQWRPSPAT
jgi:hypothetical protein